MQKLACYQDQVKAISRFEPGIRIGETQSPPGHCERDLHEFDVMLAQDSIKQEVPVILGDQHQGMVNQHGMW
jgi:hypothetical protein